MTAQQTRVAARNRYRVIHGIPLDSPLLKPGRGNYIVRTAHEQSRLNSARGMKSYRNRLTEARAYARNKYRKLAGIPLNAPLSKRGRKPEIFIYEIPRIQNRPPLP